MMKLLHQIIILRSMLKKLNWLSCDDSQTRSLFQKRSLKTA